MRTMSASMRRITKAATASTATSSSSFGNLHDESVVRMGRRLLKSGSPVSRRLCGPSESIV
jgi:hypothetical protein